MPKFAVRLLALFRWVSLLFWKLRGNTEEDVTAQRVTRGDSWSDFCDTLKAAGVALQFPGAPRDAFSQAEGYRYLSRLTRAGLMAFIEHSDPKAPVLHRVVNDITKLGADNPDNFYQTAALHGDYEYRIAGRRNTIAYLSLGTQSGNYGQGRGLPPTGHIESDQIEMDGDGNFELILSGRPQEGNWLPMTPETRTLVVRQTYGDRETEVPADLHIERINCPDDERRPSPFTARQLDEGLQQASALVAGAPLLFAKWARDFQQHSNELPQFDPDRSLAAGGDPNIAYYHSHWAVAEDEALVIEVTPPECEYWNFQLNNYWMESLDYRHHRIHTNKHLASYEDDGSIRLVVAHTDPGHPNWLETTGHTSGTMCFRWVRAEEHPTADAAGQAEQPALAGYTDMASRTEETSTDYRHPYRPLPIRALNAMGRAAGTLGRSNALDVGALVDGAKRKTGLADFGDDGHVEALDVLIRSMNDEAHLTATGRLVQRSRLDGALVQRLRIEELLRQYPEILDVDLGSIIVITGLQRTGTTLLHRLLFSHPEIRGVTGFEAMEPVPAEAVNGRRPAIPITRATLAQRAIGYLSPNFNVVHPIDAVEPEEDILLLDLSFVSQTPEATMHVPTYARWLEEQDHTQAYEYFAKVLRILCWRHPGRHWVLKTPQHMEHLDVFLKVFPGALVVQTHRDPRKTVPSFCSMVAHGRGIFSDSIDPEEIASHWLRKTRRMVDTAMQTRVTANPDQFIDVSYYNLMDDPIGQLRRITERAGIAFEGEAARKAERYLEANPQNRFGRHTYRLGDFGLDEETIDREFAAYRKQHAIPFEQDA